MSGRRRALATSLIALALPLLLLQLVRAGESGAAVAAVQLADAPLQAPPPPPASAFEEGLVREAVDLHSAHAAESAEDAKSMESLLHWAIEHSDPALLAEKAGRGDSGGGSTAPASSGSGSSGESDGGREEAVRSFLERKQRVKELYDAMNSQPTEADLIKEAVAALNEPGASEDEQVAALEELQQLVEPIDNANDLHTLGGLAPAVALLSAPHPSRVRAAAAHVIGTAASNNHKFIQQLLSLHPDAPAALLSIASLGAACNGDKAADGKSPVPEGAQEGHKAVAAAAAKGLYAVGAVSRGPPEARAAVYRAGGLSALARIAAGDCSSSSSTGGSSSSSSGLGIGRARLKALTLLTDLLELSAEEGQQGPGTAAEEADLIAPRLARAALGVLRDSTAVAGDRAGSSLQAVEAALLALRAAATQRPAEVRTVASAAGGAAQLRSALAWLHGASGDDVAAYREHLGAVGAEMLQSLEGAVQGGAAGGTQQQQDAQQEL